MNLKNRQRYTDFLELVIVLSMVFLIFTIYVPVAIWEEEQTVEDKSHFRMDNIYELESFFNRLTGQYTEDGLWAMNIVNATRDSLMADSTFLGEQIIKLKDHDDFTVTVPKGFDVDYDTTFGFQMFRRDTILDTTITVVTFSEELSRNDTIFIQRKDLSTIQALDNYRETLGMEPVERIEATSYFDTYMPDSSTFHCPLTADSYKINIKDGTFRVSSPITETFVERRYLVFAFKADNHGYIEDGVESWDR